MDLLGLKNKELAQELAVDATLVSKWRNGQKLPSDREMQLEQVAAYFVKISTAKDMVGEATDLAQSILGIPLPSGYRCELYVRDALHYSRQRSRNEAIIRGKRKQVFKLIHEIYLLENKKDISFSINALPMPDKNNCRLLGDVPEILPFMILELQRLVETAPSPDTVIFTYEENDYLHNEDFFSLLPQLFALLFDLSDMGWKVNIYLTLNGNSSSSALFHAIFSATKHSNWQLFLHTCTEQRSLRSEYFLIGEFFGVEYFNHFTQAADGHCLATYDPNVIQKLYSALTYKIAPFQAISKLDSHSLETFYSQTSRLSGHHAITLQEGQVFLSEKNLFSHPDIGNPKHVTKFGDDFSVRIIFNPSAMENFINDYRQKYASLTQEQLHRHTDRMRARLDLLISYLEQVDNFHVALACPKDFPVNQNVAICQGRYVLLRSTSGFGRAPQSEEWAIAIEDPSIVDNFFDFFDARWAAIPHRKKSHRFAIATLQRYKAMLLEPL
jgi:hypothetical protein